MLMKNMRKTSTNITVIECLSMTCIIDKHLQSLYSLDGNVLTENSLSRISENRILEVHCDITEPIHSTDEFQHKNDHIIYVMQPDYEKNIILEKPSSINYYTINTTRFIKQINVKLLNEHEHYVDYVDEFFVYLHICKTN